MLSLHSFWTECMAKEKVLFSISVRKALQQRGIFRENAVCLLTVECKHILLFSLNNKDFKATFGI